MRPPTGSYSVNVRHFETEGDAGEIGFKVVVNNRGESEEYSGVVQPDGHYCGSRQFRSLVFPKALDA